MKRLSIFMIGMISFILLSISLWSPVDLVVAAAPRLPEYITTHFTATSGDSAFGGEPEDGYFDPYFGKDADLRWMNLEKHGHPFDDTLKPSYNNYHNQKTENNAVNEDNDSNGIPDKVEVFEDEVFRATGYHCDILNYDPDDPLGDLLQGHENIQILNNVIYGTSLFTVFLPPYWTISGSYPVVLRGLGYRSDNNVSLYINKNITNAQSTVPRVPDEPFIPGEDGLIVIQSNTGGREGQGIHSNAIDDIGNFLNVASNYGADITKVVTLGVSRAGNNALVWGADPKGYAYNVLAIHAFTPPVKLGSMSMLSVATFPAFCQVINTVLGSENIEGPAPTACSYYYEDQDQISPVILRPEEKAFAALKVFSGVDNFETAVEDADDISAYGYFGGNEDFASLIPSLQEKRIWVSQGTHDSFMPMPYLLDFDNLLTEKGINHKIVFEYSFGHGFNGQTFDYWDTLEKLDRDDPDDPITPFTGNLRVFVMPEELVNIGDGNGTTRKGLVEITDLLIDTINSTPGYIDYFSEDHDATTLAFSATVPYIAGEGRPVTITLMGKEGKTWEIWLREEEGYFDTYRLSGVFGQSINYPDPPPDEQLEYGSEHVILHMNFYAQPGSYEWFFKYDGKEIPNKFTPFVSFPGNVPVKAVSVVTEDEPFPSSGYNHPDKGKDEYVNFGVDQYHPFLLVENGSPVLDPIDDFSVTAGDTIEFTLSATDPDGDSVVYDIRDANTDEFLESGFEFNGLTGEARYVTTVDDIGGHLLKAIAKDGKGGISEEIFRIEILEP